MYKTLPSALNKLMSDNSELCSPEWPKRPKNV